MNKRPGSLTRREMLALSGMAGAALAIFPSGCGRRETGHEALWVNDVQSRLNRTRVKGIEKPESTVGLAGVVTAAAGKGLSVSVAGGRHAMGGQQFGTDTILIDTSGLDRIIEFDPGKGEVEAGAGILWPDLMKQLAAIQEETANGWGIRQKQTGANRLSLGGALASNIHGRGLVYPPIVADVESFTLVDATGEVLPCSRTRNADLFRLAIGGYGLFGVMASVRLRLARRQKVERVVEIADAADLPELFEKRIEAGFIYGDYQYATDPGGGLLRRGVFSCYRPVPNDTPIPETQSRLDERKWLGLILLGHVDRATAFERYSDYYMSTSGQVYWSDLMQMSLYIDEYHRKLAASLKDQANGTEMITETYVPRASLPEFMERVRSDVIEHEVNLVYGTIRLIEKDEETFLAWAKEPFACVIFNLHVTHDAEGIAKGEADFRRLIARALEFGGSYYLTYHRWAAREQVLASYPQMLDFLKTKLERDPGQVFTSDWFRHYRDMFLA